MSQRIADAVFTLAAGVEVEAAALRDFFEQHSQRLRAFFVAEAGLARAEIASAFQQRMLDEIAAAFDRRLGEIAQFDLRGGRA